MLLILEWRQSMGWGRFFGSCGG